MLANPLRRAVGVICEYNPFHLGHAHHLTEARRLSGADIAVCAMSGSFVQRAEPAIVDPWTRARMALLHGADLVIELPTLFAVRAARDFAMGGVALLAALGCTYLAFGCEAEEPLALEKVAEVLADEPASLKLFIREGLDMGMSHPRAVTRALIQWNGLDLPEQALVDAVSQPNNALAIEYLRAIKVQSAKMTPVYVKRTSSHNSEVAEGQHASATAIRKLLRGPNPYSAAPFLPEDCCDMLLSLCERGIAPISPEALHPLMHDALRTRHRNLVGLPDWEPGAENRLGRAAQSAGTLAEALAFAKSKRLPMARLRRLAAQLLLGFTPDTIAKYPLPPYARVLGMSSAAYPLLREVSAEGIPIVHNAASLRNHPVMALDARATDIAQLCLSRPAGLHFTSQIVHRR